MEATGFKARAGTLTILYICSALGREVLLRMLAEASIAPEERSPLPDPDEEIDIDRVLDPGDGPAFAAEVGGSVDPDAQMQITPAGQEMFFVGNLLERWLGDAPDGPRELGDVDAGLAVAGLAYGWETTAIHALAERPCSLEELNEALRSVTYRAIEEHIELMEEAGLVEALDDVEGTARYEVTDWLREGIAPLAAAARLERHFPAADTFPPDHLDVEAAFQLVLPLLDLPQDVSGTCRLGVEIDGGRLPRMAGATVTVQSGRIVAGSADLKQEADAWARGSPIDWLDTLVDPPVAKIETGGEEHLVASLLAGLHEALFAPPGE